MKTRIVLIPGFFMCRYSEVTLFVEAEVSFLFMD